MRCVVSRSRRRGRGRRRRCRRRRRCGLWTWIIIMSYTIVVCPKNARRTFHVVAMTFDVYTRACVCADNE